MTKVRFVYGSNMLMLLLLLGSVSCEQPVTEKSGHSLEVSYVRIDNVIRNRDGCRFKRLYVGLKITPNESKEQFQLQLLNSWCDTEADESLFYLSCNGDIKHLLSATRNEFLELSGKKDTVVQHFSVETLKRSTLEKMFVEIGPCLVEGEFYYSGVLVEKSADFELQFYLDDQRSSTNDSLFYASGDPLPPPSPDEK